MPMSIMEVRRKYMVSNDRGSVNNGYGFYCSEHDKKMGSRA